MKYIFLLANLLTTSTFSFSQSEDEKAVRQTVNEFQAALRNNDADAVGTFLTDDYAFIGRTPWEKAGTSMGMNKTQRLATIKSGQLKYESFNYEDIKVVLYGNTAIVRTTLKCKLSGQDADTLHVALTLLKKDEHWQLAGECAGDSCDR